MSMCDGVESGGRGGELKSDIVYADSLHASVSIHTKRGYPTQSLLNRALKNILYQHLLLRNSRSTQLHLFCTTRCFVSFDRINYV